MSKIFQVEFRPIQADLVDPGINLYLAEPASRPISADPSQSHQLSGSMATKSNQILANLQL